MNSENIHSTLRPSQEQVINYTGGPMGVAAVPGSGKTFTLSHLAASLVERLLDETPETEQLNREVLVVTFTNPAVNSFRNRIASLMTTEERGLLPYIGYRVRTLHGLAHDIVRMRPALVGLTEHFDILDERVTTAIIRDLAETWVRAHDDELLPYIGLDLAEDESQLRWIIRKHAPDLVERMAYEAIRLGKDHQWSPDRMLAALKEAAVPLPLAEIGIRLYGQYQRSLSYRGAVDFDDLVRLAMEALENDAEFLTRLQERWPYILEDEAQDSSKLQNRMLRMLSGGRNWVRVGDPNQAIYTTFTTADSNFLIQFLDEKDTIARQLPVSGRSAPAIIKLANHLVKWSQQASILPQGLRGALADYHIVPTDSGDPQANPQDGFVYIDWEPGENVTPERELHRVVTSIERWLPDHPDWTIAVLVPENSRGFKIAEELKEREIDYEELLRSTSATRDAASRLQIVFDFLADPTERRRLAQLYEEVWWPMTTGDPDDTGTQLQRDEIARALRNLHTTEDFLWPGPEGDWIKAQAENLPASVLDSLVALRRQAQVWLEASTLPVDQLVLTISQDLFATDEDDPTIQQSAGANLALGHKIAVVLKGIAQNNPDYRLRELSGELRAIAHNERRFLGFDDAGEGYEPTPGRVTVATMHAAKGLEWDRVYLMAVNSYSFPAAQPGESYFAEKWFIRDELNMQAETQRQIELLMEGREAKYVESEASREARIDYAAERLRLLYVGITRARRDLIITWNMGRYWEQGRRNEPATALIELANYWKQESES